MSIPITNPYHVDTIYVTFPPVYACSPINADLC